jgi:hypothetical protein
MGVPASLFSLAFRRSPVPTSVGTLSILTRIFRGSPQFSHDISDLPYRHRRQTGLYTNLYHLLNMVYCILVTKADGKTPRVDGWFTF